MNFNWKNSIKWGAFAGFIFSILNTFGDYMLLGNSIYKEFYSFKFYKPLVSNIVIWSLGFILFDWVGNLFSNKKDLKKQNDKLD